MSRTRHLSTLLALAATLLAAQASAQTPEPSFPTRAIKIISASPAGGGVDLSARIIADQLQKLWGHPVTVENRTGGSNNIAGEAVAKAEPDGYTLLATPPNTLTANAVLFKQLNYDPAALEPVAIMAVAPNVLAVKDGSPAKTVADLIALAKANPGKLSYASQGNGSTTHLTSELFSSRTGHQARARPLPGRGARRERPRRRSCGHDVLRPRHHPAAASGRQGQDHRHGDARPAVADPAPCRRSTRAASKGSVRRPSSR